MWVHLLREQNSEGSMARARAHTIPLFIYAGHFAARRNAILFLWPPLSPRRPTLVSHPHADSSPPPSFIFRTFRVFVVRGEHQASTKLALHRQRSWTKTNVSLSFVHLRSAPILRLKRTPSLPIFLRPLTLNSPFALPPLFHEFTLLKGAWRRNWKTTSFKTRDFNTEEFFLIGKEFRFGRR